MMARWVPAMIMLVMTVSCPTPHACEAYETTCLTCSLPGDTVPSASYPGWNVLEIDTDTSVTASVAVTGADGPRIAYVTGDDELKYALCDTECTVPSNWTIVNLGTADGFVKVVLGPEDKPQILYGLSNSGMYTYCNGDCSNPAIWILPITVPAIVGPALFALDSAGNPRSAGLSMNGGGSLCVSYVFCDGNCHDPQDWSDTIVGPCQQGLDVPFPVGFSMNNQAIGQDGPRILSSEPSHMGGWGSHLTCPQV